MSTGKELATKIMEHAKNTIEYCEDPKNRIVTDVKFVPLEGNTKITSVIVTSNCDTWAEDTKSLFSTSQIFKPEDASCMIGKTEEELFDLFYKDDLAELVRSLNRLCEENAPTYVSNGEIFFDNKGELDDWCEGLACSIFISMGGSVNYKNIHAINAFGYDVFAGDKDSFGWLTGCIRKKGDARILVFG